MSLPITKKHWQKYKGSTIKNVKKCGHSRFKDNRPHFLYVRLFLDSLNSGQSEIQEIKGHRSSFDCNGFG